MNEAVGNHPDRVSISLVQARHAGSKDANVELAVNKIGQAAAQGADVVCLQELFAGAYPCQSEDHTRFDEAEPIPGPTTERLARAAAEHVVVVIGSHFERRAPGVYHNTAVVYERDGRIVGLYRKMHIPDDPSYYEKFYFTPGDLGFLSFDTSAGPLGVCVCWDQWFPEAARLTAMAGAQILFYPTAIGWLPEDKEPLGKTQHSAWETVMRAHAVTNGIYVAAANRVGAEGNIQFWGASFVADPGGVVLARAPHDEEALLMAECDLSRIDAVRTHWPFFRDRRIDAYAGLGRRMIDE